MPEINNNEANNKKPQEQNLKASWGFQYAAIDWQGNHPYSKTFGDSYYSLKVQVANQAANHETSHETSHEAGHKKLLEQDWQDELVGLAESQHVFLKGNNIVNRFALLEDNESFTIAETGFGSGLNFFASCLAWSHNQNTHEKNAAKNASLHFYSVEKYPLSPPDFIKISNDYAAQWPELEVYISALQQQYYNLSPGLQTIQLSINGSNIFLHLIIGDVEWALDKYSFYADAWFLDGFSPSQNPQMWQLSVFTRIFNHCHKSSTLSSFTVAGFVRRGLAEAGFVASKVAGFGAKRECIAASVNEEKWQINNQQQIKKTWQKPWLPNHSIGRISDTKDKDAHAKNKQAQKILVIGAGIAGSACANALAKKGYKVDIWDSHKDSYSNDYGSTKNNSLGFANCPTHAISYVRFYPHEKPLSEWCLQSYTHSIRNFEAINKQRDLWTSRGLWQLYQRDEGKTRFELLQQANTLTSIANFYNSVEEALGNKASEQEVINNQDTKVLHYKHAGSVNTSQLRKHRLQHANITGTNKTVTRIEKIISNNQTIWRVYDQDNNSADYNKVVIANGQQCEALLKNIYVDNTSIFGGLKEQAWQAFWQIKQVKGQETIVEFAKPHGIKQVICGSHYLIPISENRIAIGAGFYRDVIDNKVEESLHQLNITAVKQDYPFLNVDWDNSKIIGGYAGVRCYSPDYIPIVGELFDISKYLDLLQEPLAKDKNYRFSEQEYHQYQSEVVLQGLYICTAMGARGVSSSGLAAEIIACAIDKAMPPVSQDLEEAVHPARFLQRAVVKRKLVN